MRLLGKFCHGRLLKMFPSLSWHGLTLAHSFQSEPPALGTLTTTINPPLQPICHLQTDTPPAAKCPTGNVSRITALESAPALQNQTPILHGENSTSLGNAPLPLLHSEQRAAQPVQAAVEMTTRSAGSRSAMFVNRRDLTRFRRMSKCGSG